ncbi:pineapple eye protein-like [Eurosta solidaginis]|uniref:pineapple eye protein-like n=1 Tax=Eurosta solidaginis TaxID=178769 RepID=UPI0035306D0B
MSDSAIVEYKTCDICKDKTNCAHDLILFGDWQQSRDITVHYFCLLLSTHLPQRGKDCGGINGFLLRDIRKEITAASKRVCCYCGRMHASIQCHKCKEYFHIRCARLERCLLIFHNDFRSYCDDCIPRKELQPIGLKSRPSSFERCSICRGQMGLYNEIVFIFGKCCNKGYAHNVCVQKYALAAGYYLRCIWCRKEEFRISVRQQGIFVPDRDARWETQKGIYTDLHRGHSTCNMDLCFCPRGRDYNKGKWSITLCSLCGSVGAHNPKCLLGKENAKDKVSIFKCSTCASTETKINNNDASDEATAVNRDDIIDKSIFMTKKCSVEEEKIADSFTPTFSEDDDTQSVDSFVTVIPQKPIEIISTTVTSHISEQNRGDHNGKIDVNIIPVEADVTISIISERSNEESLAQQRLIEETALIQQSLAKDIQADDETQILGVTSLNIPKVWNDTGSSRVQQPLTLDVRYDIDRQVFATTSPNIKVTNLSSPKSRIENPNLADLSSTTMPSAETIQELYCSGIVVNQIDNNQSPEVTSSSQDQADWASFILYEYDDVKKVCIGSATVRINLNEERFAGMTLEQIEDSSCDLITDADIISRSDDIGIFAKIDSIIAEYM